MACIWCLMGIRSTFDNINDLYELDPESTKKAGGWFVLVKPEF